MLLEALYVFMSSSKIHVLFMKRQQQCNPHKQPLELQKLSDTRWVCRYAAVNAICRTFDSILLTVEEVADASVNEYSQAVEARGLYHQIKSFSFLVTLITFDQILECTKQLSDSLQSNSMDLSRASELVDATKSLLTRYRSDDHWKVVYDQTTNLHDIIVEFTSRRRKRSALLNDSVIYETTGSRETPSAIEELKTKPLLDHELNDRFQKQNTSILKGISALTPTTSDFLCLADLEPFTEQYGVTITENQLKVEVNLVKQLQTLTLESVISYLQSCHQHTQSSSN